MFYRYFRVFNLINTVCGIRKPFLSPLGWTSKIFAFLIAIFLIVQHLFALKFQFRLHWNKHMEQISSLNNVIVNVTIIMLNTFNGKTLLLLYETNKKILSTIISEKSVKMLALKINLWVAFQSLIFIPLIILEVVFQEPPFVLLIRLPLFLTLTHLIIHLCLILSVLKVINDLLVNSFRGFKKINNNFVTAEIQSNPKSYVYFLSTDFYFTEVDQRKNVDLKFLCNVYDQLCTGLELLQFCHGVQMLLIIWLMFSSAVLTVTIVANNQANTPWLEIIKGSQIFVWFMLACYVEDKIRQQVERTDLLIIKYLIDFQTDPSKKSVLQTFRVLVNTNRLQFNACNLYHINFNTLLGAVVSVITYSIISIQLL